MTAKFTVRAYNADGSFAFGATLNCLELSAAVSKFNSLPLEGRRAELLMGARVVARRDPATPENGRARKPTFRTSAKGG